MVAALYDKDPEIRRNAYNMIRNEVTTSTSSMTSIPKPLKFLREHFEAIKDFTNKLDNDNEFKLMLNDLLAMLVMIAPNTTETSLSYILTGSKKNITQWGLEFVRNLSGDIGNEFVNRLDTGRDVDDLISLVNVIVPYLIEAHSESEAVDILLEVEKLDSIMDFVNQNNYKRTCLYLLASANYAADTEELRSILEIAYNIYQKFGEYANALRVAIKLNNQLFI
jgi:26S proteasome regulatory subunit N1